jgi:prolipoprotein diacylglyceryl transferase
MDPILLSLGPVTVRWYGLFFLSGFYLGYYYMFQLCKREGKSTAKLDSLLIYLIAGTTIGARLGHCLFYEWDYFSQNPLEILMIWHGGLASHGGTLGVIVSLYLFCRKNPEFELPWLMDRIAIPTALTVSFIRLGNLMNSEIIGKPTDGTWGVVFDRVDTVPRHPTMVYESIFYFCIWLTCLYWYRRFGKQTPAGLIVGWAIGMNFLARIFIEVLKENQEAFENTMTLNMGQILSIPFAVGGFAVFFWALKRGGRLGPAEAAGRQR